MAKSAIAWTDNSVPVVVGCNDIGPGCHHCYARRLAWRLAHHPNPAVSGRYQGVVENRDGKLFWTGRLNFDIAQLDAIRKTRRAQTWFLSPVGDLFHQQVPATVVGAVLATAAVKPAQRLILLTKRYDLMAERLSGRHPRPNVWLGMSVANDKDAAAAASPLRTLHDQGWQTLVSYEPAIGPIDWAAHGLTFLSWIISGGETGNDIRPSHPDWHRATRDFCLQHGIAFFFKQIGAWKVFYDRDQDDPDWRAIPAEEPGKVRRLNLAGGIGFHGARLVYLRKVGKRDAGRLLDGRIWDEVPWQKDAS
jgi:protein gp37